MSGRIIEPNRVVNRSLVALIYILLKGHPVKLRRGRFRLSHISYPGCL